MTSDWDYYPGTPPGHNLSLVIIGLSAIESSNSLLIPLAGHEFGHNVWNERMLADTIDREVFEVTAGVIQREFWQAFIVQSFGAVDPQLSPEQLTHDVAGQGIILRLANDAVFQLEEYFCDAFGLLMFAESYLKAFSALCCPGVPGDPGHYPALSARFRALVPLAISEGVDSDVHQIACVPEPAPETPASRVIQRVVQQLVARVQHLAREIVTATQIPRRNRQNVDLIAAQFRSLVPASGRHSLTDLINGAWQVSAGSVPAHQPLFTPDDWRELVNQMTLKSCEVTEYHERLRE